MKLSPRSRAVVGSSLAVGFCVALVHCGDDDATGPGFTLGGIDSSIPAVDGTGPAVDSGGDAKPLEAGANPSDSGARDGGDAGIEAGDAGDAGIDAAPVFDDAGCSIPQGPLPTLAGTGVPTDGLVLWLRADHGVSTTDAGTVCRWNDLSGKNNTFGSDAPAKPTLQPAPLRGKPGVAFTSNNTYLARNDVLGIPATSGRTIAAFGAVADTAHRFEYLYMADFTTNNKYFGIDQNTWQSSGGKEGVYVTESSFDSNVATTGAPRSHVLAVDSFVAGTDIASVLHYDIDGTATTLARVSGGGNFIDYASANRSQLGGPPDSAFTGATLGEMLVYSRGLNTTERAAINTYFLTRYPK